MGTLLVGLVIVAAVIMAIRSIMKEHGSCSGGCTGCSGSCGKCHPSTIKGINELVKESKTRHAG